uniref:Aminotransferase class I/classII domain-containing protein n=1 Tax=Aegilops tauschii subsp. strangulata TaxID=200361 RepID=A0A453FFW7_AEGTS
PQTPPARRVRPTAAGRKKGPNQRFSSSWGRDWAVFLCRRRKNRLRRLVGGAVGDALSSHPAVREAAVKAAQEYGMGLRGSSLICGYTTYHKLVEESLAELQKKEDCLLCPTGFSANTALMTALGSISSLLAARRKPPRDQDRNFLRCAEPCLHH